MPRSAVRVAREALAAGRAALPDYGSLYSRRDDMQPQLFALLVLRQFLRTDYRGVVALFAEWSELRRALGLAEVQQGPSTTSKPLEGRPMLGPRACPLRHHRTAAVDSR